MRTANTVSIPQNARSQDSKRAGREAHSDIEQGARPLDQKRRDRTHARASYSLAQCMQVPIARRVFRVLVPNPSAIRTVFNRPDVDLFLARRGGLCRRDA